MTRLLLLLPLLLSLAGCDLLWPSGDAATARLGNPFWLDYSETTALDGDALRITFEEVETEGRCPEDADCVWEGFALIELRLEGAVQADSLALEIPGLVPVPHERAEAVTESRYRFKLLELAPYPNKAGRPSSPSVYRALLLVESA